MNGTKASVINCSRYS